MHRPAAFLQATILGSLLSLSGAATHAAPFTVFTAAQSVTVNIANPSGAPNVPPSSGVAVTARNNFLGGIGTLGTMEFEQSATPSFSYGTGGTASVTPEGSLTRINGNGSPAPEWALGRYNTTPGLGTIGTDPDGAPIPNRGHWVEASALFAYSFAGATERVSAFGFYATDLGDFDGTLFIELWREGGLIDGGRFQVTTQPPDANGQPRADNGNLTFFGVRGATDGDWFDRVRFVLGQGTGPTDFVGFDSLVVGRSLGNTPGTVPTPGTLALAGLSLLALGALTRRRARSA